MKVKNGERLTPRRAGEWALNNTNILLMFLLILIGAVTSKNFFQASNLANVLRQTTVNAPLKIGDVVLADVCGTPILVTKEIF